MSVKFSKDHEWVSVAGDIATIGITNHAQEQLGDVVFVELPAIGKKVSKGGDAAVVESVKAASEVYAPITGEVVAVNKELEGLGEFVDTAVDLLKPSGRFVAISFHSLEDRILKQELRRLSGSCQCPPRIPVCTCGARKVVEILTRRPVIAGDAEVDINPRARSAKLRACEKLAGGPDSSYEK